MAYLGLRKPIVGKMNVNGGYDDPIAVGKAIGITVTPNYAEASLYGDDIQAEYDKTFNYADITLNTTSLPVKAHEVMFGHSRGENGTEIVQNSNDEQNYLGMGWASVEKVDGVRRFCANFVYKSKFSEPNEDYSTKGENIEYKTPSLSGRAVSLDDGVWKCFDTFETEREALNYIYGKFGKKLETLNVQSAEGTNTGETQITVTPEKSGTNTYFYKTGKNISLPAYNEVCNGLTGWTSWDGSNAILAKTGDTIVVVEVTAEDYFARKAGETTVTAKTEE